MPISREQYEGLFGSDFDIGYDQFQGIVAAANAKRGGGGGGGGGGYGPSDWLGYQRAKGPLEVETSLGKAYAQQVPKYRAKKQIGSGWEFFDPWNNAITAAQYAQMTGKPITQVLSGSENPDDWKILDAINRGVSYDALRKRWPWVFGGV